MHEKVSSPARAIINKKRRETQTALRLLTKWKKTESETSINKKLSEKGRRGKAFYD